MPHTTGCKPTQYLLFGLLLIKLDGISVDRCNKVISERYAGSLMCICYLLLCSKILHNDAHHTECRNASLSFDSARLRYCRSHPIGLCDDLNKEADVLFLLADEGSEAGWQDVTKTHITWHFALYPSHLFFHQPL